MPPVIWGQTGDGADPSTFPLLVAPHANGKSKALVLPGVAGNYASSPDVNLLDADSAHFEQSFGDFVAGTGASAFALSSEQSYFGSSSAKATADGTSAQLMRSTASSAAGPPVSPSTEYTWSFWVYTDTADREALAQMVDYDSGNVTGGTGSGSVTPLTVGQWTQVSVTHTTASDADHARLVVTYRQTDDSNPAASEVVYFDAVCLREGSDATFIPSTRITGDIDIRAHVQPQEWASGASQVLLSKYEGASQHSYLLDVLAAGTVRLVTSADGAANIAATSTTAVPFGEGEGGWVRVTLDVDNGASGRTTKFYTSDDGTTWTQLGTTLTAGATTSIHAGTSPIEFGTYDSGTTPLHGAILHAEVRDGIDGPVVAEFDADDLEAGNENLLSAEYALPQSNVFSEYFVSNVTSLHTHAESWIPAVGSIEAEVLASTAGIYTSEYHTADGVTSYTVTIAVKAPVGIDYEVGWRVTTGAEAFVNNTTTTVTGDGDWQVTSYTVTGTDTYRYRPIVMFTAPAVGSTFYIGGFCDKRGTSTDFVYPNGSGLSSETGNVIATYRTGDATAECVDRACWQFTGSEWLEIADRDALNFGTSDFEVAARLSTRDVSDPYMAIVDKRVAGGGWLFDYRVGPGNSSVGGAIEGPSINRTVAGGAAYPTRDGNAYTVGLSRSSASVDAIVDGVVAGTATAQPESVDNNEQMVIGRRATAGGPDLIALMDWVAVWPRALTASERTELAAWDGRPGSSAPGSLYGTVLYLNAADTPTQTAHANAEVNNSLSSLVHPQMGSAAMRARKREIGANAGSRLWDITVDEDGDAIPDVDEFHPRYLDGKAWWFEAGSVQANDGDAVSVWRDISGNGRDASQATGDSQPTLVANGLNGRAVVRFDGVDDFVQTSAGGSSDQPNTMFVVTEVASLGLGFAVDGATASTRNAIGLSASSSRRFYAGTVVDGASTASVGVPFIAAASFDGASSVGYVNGATEVTSGDFGAQTLTGVTLGSNYNGDGAFWDGDVAEVIVFDRTLTTAEMNGVGNYLASKYGLTWTDLT